MLYQVDCWFLILVHKQKYSLVGLCPGCLETLDRPLKQCCFTSYNVALSDMGANHLLVLSSTEPLKLAKPILISKIQRSETFMGSEKRVPQRILVDNPCPYDVITHKSI